jgi:hypothetical protein
MATGNLARSAYWLPGTLDEVDEQQEVIHFPLAR